MSFGGPSLGSGDRTVRREFEFGQTYVVKPKGKHLATIVWLHGLAEDGSRWSQLLETLPLPNIKWICPTSPCQPVTLVGGFPLNAWFDVGYYLSEDAIQDVEGLDASTAHVLSLLLTEPSDIKIGVGGFSLGAAAALYFAGCFASGKLGNGNAYSTRLDALICLSGWLPCPKDLINKVEGDEAVARATSLPILYCHGKGDDSVPYSYAEKSAERLLSAGFKNLTFKTYDSLDHHTMAEEMDDVCSWLTSKLELKASSSCSSSSTASASQLMQVASLSKESERWTPNPKCYCHHEAILTTFWTNPGRKFYTCNGKETRCGYFSWLDNRMGERATHIIHGLLKLKNHLEVVQAKDSQIRKLKFGICISWVLFTLIWYTLGRCSY